MINCLAFGKKIKQQSSDISVLMHRRKSLLKNSHPQRVGFCKSGVAGIFNQPPEVILMQVNQRL